MEKQKETDTLLFELRITRNGDKMNSKCESKINDMNDLLAVLSSIAEIQNKILNER